MRTVLANSQDDYDEGYVAGERSCDPAINREWRMRLGEQMRRQDAEAHLAAIREARLHWMAVRRDRGYDVFDSPAPELVKAHEERVNDAFYALLAAIQYAPDNAEHTARWFAEYLGKTPEGAWENEGGALAPERP